MNDTRPRRLGALLFPGFELLDLFGPLEMFGNLQGIVDVVTVAQQAGAVPSAQGPSAVAQYGFGDCPPIDLLLIPGGMATRTEVENTALIDWLRSRVPSTEVTMTVCSGTALLAKTTLTRYEEGRPPEARNYNNPIYAETLQQLEQVAPDSPQADEARRMAEALRLDMARFREREEQANQEQAALLEERLKREETMLARRRATQNVVQSYPECESEHAPSSKRPGGGKGKAS